jgi:hypothetical protein
MQSRFIPHEDCPLKDILSFLIDHCGGNVKKKDTVKVSASGTFWSDYPPKTVVNFKSSSKTFTTANVANLWIRIDFRNYCIDPTHDLIRTRTEWDGYHPRSWVIEASSDAGQN